MPGIFDEANMARALGRYVPEGETLIAGIHAVAKEMERAVFFGNCTLGEDRLLPAGQVAAAVRSKAGRIYVGVCIDTCSTLGICAERNAIFNMITNGEHEIDRVLCIPPNEGKGAPCGACRELMVQLMPGTYKDIDIMVDYAGDRVMKLGELTPEWWIG